jgi:hypothetical protein
MGLFYSLLRRRSMGPQYSTWNRILAILGGVQRILNMLTMVLSIALAAVSALATGWLILALVERPSKTATDWTALVFLNLLLLGLLACVAILVWAMYRLLARMAT